MYSSWIGGCEIKLIFGVVYKFGMSCSARSSYKRDIWDVVGFPLLEVFHWKKVGDLLFWSFIIIIFFPN